MNILFIGDVVGSPGRRALERALLPLIDRRKVDFTIVNVENAAGGFGLTVELFGELSKLPIDVFSSGNHIWDKREIYEVLNSSDRLLRPANYPPGNPGRGVTVQTTASGVPVGVLNLQGQVFMPAHADSPFRVADDELARLPDVKVVVVDFHAEATSEKVAMGWYLDGRVSAVLGTHTHVATADETVRPGGTAYQTDVGMTGAYEGVIGFARDRVIEKFLAQTPKSFETAKRDIRLCGAIVEVNEETGRATAIERVAVKVE
ncbi:MAG: TIGR00282 family metallophosphoesterase [Acidobacteriota bacterium]|nr:TIGR00282 family metallophosphoesterase [Acidobacteriota bacterium]MDQ5871370.1 TIGR00282 family metallophosphoesterase [Acidobacteriota bacterium]